MWTKTKSLLLSRILTYVAAGMAFIITFFVPAICRWYEDVSVGDGLFGDSSIVIPLCICLYFCEAMAFLILWCLHVLLGNINKENVFISENTACLRRISWACMLAGCAIAVFSLWKFIFFLPAVLIIMFGLIMRVLKNVFEKAVEIKSENDYTI